MYDGDSFFNLTASGQAGLAALSGVLAMAMVWLVWRIARHRGVVLRLLIAAGLFTGFLWLSPQIYYLYYLAVFDGLPLQWVPALWPRPDHAALTLVFSRSDTLAAHSQGVLGIVMVCVAFAAGLDRPNTRSHQRSTCAGSKEND